MAAITTVFIPAVRVMLNAENAAQLSKILETAKVVDLTFNPQGSVVVREIETVPYELVKSTVHPRATFVPYKPPVISPLPPTDPPPPTFTMS